MNSTRTKIAHHRFRLLLLALSAAAIYARSTTSIRCVLFQKCVTFGPTPDHPRGYHRDYWTCKLSNVDSERLNGLQFVDIALSSSSILVNATSGTSVLSVSEAIIDEEEASMHIPDNADVYILDDADETFNKNSINVRHLAKAKSSGVLNTLVIRVIDRHGIEPTSSTEKLIDDVFADDVSLKTQMEACSYNKLRIEPFRGTTPRNIDIQNGVVDIQMDFDITSNATGVDNAAITAAKDTIGDLDDPMFDLVMICLPPGQSDILAFAFNNSKYSFYNDEWCGYVDAQMHEVGHNLGLAHSGSLEEGEYGDESGLMGVASGKDDYSQCYNPQKSYQVGWYDDQTRSIDPLDNGDRMPLEFTLNGIADYGKNPDALVVLRLTQEDRDQDYYIGYNRATGIHADTTEDADHITVVRKDFGAPEAYGQSTKIASLRVGQKMVLNDFNGSGRDIRVAFSGVTDGGDARVTILEGDNEIPVPSGSCQKFTVEVLTDGFPDDNSWYIVDTDDTWGRVGATSVPFDTAHTEYRQEICLPRGPTAKTYRFAVEDKFGDGIGPGGGDGDEGYKVVAEDGTLLFSGGSDFTRDNTWVYHTLQVDGDPNYRPTAPPTQLPTSHPPVRKDAESLSFTNNDDTGAPKESGSTKKRKKTRRNKRKQKRKQKKKEEKKKKRKKNRRKKKRQGTNEQ